MAIDVVAVIGAGTMGRGIAYCAALGGYKTILQDLSVSILESALENVRADLEQGIARGKITAHGRDAALARLETSVSLEEAARDADLIIEAVPEELNLKIEMFRRFENTAKESAIFASNTSSMSITEMAAATRRPERCIGMHFFNPVSRMKLVELVRALETSDATVAACRDIAERMGKEVVLVRESPGFITTRINALIGNEAFAMLEAGIASAEDIDKAVKLGLNHPMGPFELVDMVGLDVRLSNTEYLHQTLGEKFRPNPLLRQYVKAGRLGRKTGRGVYDYRKTAEGPL